MTARKRRDHCRKVGYKAGLKSPQAGKTLSVSSVDEKKYVRLTAKSFESRIHVHDNILTFRDTDGTDTNVSALRPRANVSHVVDEYSSNYDLSQHPNLYTNKLMVQAEVQVLFNTAFKEHKQIKPECQGDLNFDAANSKRWGLGWRERLKCTKCQYTSQYRNLYEEVEVKKGRGRRAAKVNVGLQLGLCSTPISNTGVSRILNHANIISPNKAAMQRLSCKVNKNVEGLNVKDMHEQRFSLVKENAQIGQKDAKTVNVEGDTCYNNPMFNSDSTPFQAGSIATTTFCENNTKAKKIVGVHIANSSAIAKQGGECCVSKP